MEEGEEMIFSISTGTISKDAQDVIANKVQVERCRLFCIFLFIDRDRASQAFFVSQTDQTRG